MGYSVNRKDVTILCETFRQLYMNRSLREQYGKHARQVAFDNHDAMKVRERFRRLLCATPSKDVRELEWYVIPRAKDILKGAYYESFSDRWRRFYWHKFMQ